MVETMEKTWIGASRAGRSGVNGLLRARFREPVSVRLRHGSGSASVLAGTLMSIELFLEVRMSIGSFRQMRHGNLEYLAAKLADSDGWSSTEPFDHLESPLRHGSLVSHSPSLVAKLAHFRGGTNTEP
jgi:hypothetical protein